MTDTTRNILIEKGDGTWQRLTIPSAAKVTFGPLTPGRAPGWNDGGNGKESSGLYLRVYKTKEQQLAVIANVRSFRDEECVLGVPDASGDWLTVTDVELMGQGALTQMREAAELKKPEYNNTLVFRSLYKNGIKYQVPDICQSCLGLLEKVPNEDVWFCDRCSETYP